MIRKIVIVLMVISFVFGVKINSAFSVVVFPVDGMLGDSYTPRDEIEDPNTVVGARKNYTMVWGGKYFRSAVVSSQRVWRG